MVETGGHPDPNNAVGDNGLAFGILQLHAGYVQDAAQHAGEDWVHEDAFDPVKAVLIFRSYMDRYATAERLGHPVTIESIAKIHNGGPNGFKKHSTEPYWEKVKLAINR